MAVPALTAGVTYRDSILTVAASTELTGDLTGMGICVVGDATSLTLRKARLQWPAGARLLAMGLTAGGVIKGAPSLIAEDTDLDLLGILPNFAAGVSNNNQSKGRFTRTRFHNGSRLLLMWAGPLEIEECYFGEFGLNPRDADHLEQFQYDGGPLSISRTLFDLAASAGRIPARGGLTAGVFLKATYAPINATMSGNVIFGARRLGLPYPIQLKADKFNVDVAIGNHLIQKGTSGYIGCAAADGLRVRVLDLGGNRDADTYAPINLTVGF